MLPESVSPWTGVTVQTDKVGQRLVTLDPVVGHSRKLWQLLQVPEDSLETALTYRLTG